MNTNDSQRPQLLIKPVTARNFLKSCPPEGEDSGRFLAMGERQDQPLGTQD